MGSVSEGYLDAPGQPRLLALSDLHVAFPENRKIVEDLRPGSDEDWLLLAGDVGELSPDIEWALRTLSERSATARWTPDRGGGPAPPPQAVPPGGWSPGHPAPGAARRRPGGGARGPTPRGRTVR